MREYKVTIGCTEFKEKCSNPETALARAFKKFRKEVSTREVTRVLRCSGLEIWIEEVEK